MCTMLFCYKTSANEYHLLRLCFYLNVSIGVIYLYDLIPDMNPYEVCLFGLCIFVHVKEELCTQRNKYSEVKEWALLFCG